MVRKSTAINGDVNVNGFSVNYVSTNDSVPIAGLHDVAGNYSSGKDYLLIPRTKLYKRRFLMLFLYGLCTMSNGFQWLQFSILTSVVTCYYNASVESVYWTSILFMVMFVPFTVPVSWMLNVKGLRFTLILAAAGNALTSCIQCMSLAPNRFYVVIISQTVAAIAQVFSLSVPPYLAALWFGPKEVSRACAIGAFSNMFGNAIGFLIPPLLVPSDCLDKQAVHIGLSRLALGQAVFNSAIYVAIVFWFEDKPKIPPSLAEARKPEKTDSTWQSVLRLMKDRNFVMVATANGTLLSVYYATSPLLNQMITRTFPGRVVDAGWIGFLSTITGMSGSIICGYFLDKTQKFKLYSIVVHVLSLMIFVTYTLVSSVKILWIHYLIFGVMGFVMIAYNPIGFQFAAEITYPEPEGTSGSIVIGILSLLGVFITEFASWLMQSYSTLHSNLFFCCCLLVSTVIAFNSKCNSKRTLEGGGDIKPSELPS